MKIEKSEGCTSFYTLVDGKDLNDFSPEELDLFVDKILATIKERIKQNNISIERIIDCIPYDDYSYDSHVCDQCGDTVSRTTWLDI